MTGADRNRVAERCDARDDERREDEVGGVRDGRQRVRRENRQTRDS